MIKKLAPFITTFLAVETILRLIFIFISHDHINNMSNIMTDLFYGFIYDLVTLTYIIWLPLLYYTFIPNKFFKTTYAKTLSILVYLVFLYGLLFSSIAEMLFWQEFQSRFNFIAVDYLIYTTEVVKNIWESYSIVQYMLLILAFAIAVTWLIHKKLLYTPKSITKLHRLFYLGCAIILPSLSFLYFNSNLIANNENRLSDEIAKNGIYSLFSAYLNNKLPYKQFYISIDDNVAKQNVEKLLDKKFIDNNFTYEVKSGNKEKHLNVMLVVLESMSAEYLTMFGNKENITPNLDKIIEKSLSFSNTYATGTRTVYGLSAITLSLPPMPGNSIIRQTDNENLFTIGSIFHDRNYDVSFIYGGYGYFDNMNYFFKNNGYNIVDRADFTDDEITFANAWGVCDEDLFNKTLAEANKSTEAGKKFFFTIMTTSNHRPFTYPDGKIDIESGTGKRNGGVKYTDYAVGEFIRKSQQEPWFKDTIFVIVADHTAGGARKIELDPHHYQIPFIIFAPHHIKPEQNINFISQIDVAPTLLGLMNFNYKSHFWGIDAMKRNPQRAFISNYQQVGYITPDDLTILKPVKQVMYYQYNNQTSEFAISKTDNKHKLLDTISYFQTVTTWQDWDKYMNSLAK